MLAAAAYDITVRDAHAQDIALNHRLRQRCRLRVAAETISARRCAAASPCLLRRPARCARQPAAGAARPDAPAAAPAGRRRGAPLRLCRPPCCAALAWLAAGLLALLAACSAGLLRGAAGLLRDLLPAWIVHVIPFWYMASPPLFQYRYLPL